MIETGLILYKHGVYKRKGNRIYLNKDNPPPPYISVKPETKEIHDEGCVSYVVDGWAVDLDFEAVTDGE